jgi:hypothetical protein
MVSAALGEQGLVAERCRAAGHRQRLAAVGAAQELVGKTLGLEAVEIFASAPPLAVVMELEDVVPRRQDGARDHHRCLLPDLPLDALAGAGAHGRTVAVGEEPNESRQKERPGQQHNNRADARERPAFAPELAPERTVQKVCGRAVVR